ncbi:hypothetical protein BB560_000110 [Smittium megazygosporum]|uniref:ZZ-type domain-containing protein n=1 Tax=Smittium megazygosporum TaxID=133381 RepID=A0A2T9ZLH5_9FUNG|nr:hypothetical protein BB560_000110 [Smittium megazygosporum]
MEMENFQLNSKLSLLTMGAVVGFVSCIAFMKIQEALKVSTRSAKYRRPGSSGRNRGNRNQTRSLLRRVNALRRIPSNELRERLENEDSSQAQDSLNQMQNRLLDLLALNPEQFSNEEILSDITSEIERQINQFENSFNQSLAENELQGLNHDSIFSLETHGINDFQEQVQESQNNEENNLQLEASQDDSLAVPNHDAADDQTEDDSNTEIQESSMSQLYQNGNMSFEYPDPEILEKYKNILSGAGGSKFKLFQLLYLLYDVKEKRKSLVHSGVACDQCQESPIKGVRYKCTQCPNFDLCEFCESRNVHSEHVFLKIKIPTSTLFLQHTPILNSFYIGNMLGDIMPAGFAQHLISEAMKMKPKFSQSELYGLYDQYCSIATYDRAKHGIGITSFAKCMGIQGVRGPFLNKILFEFYDSNDDSLIDFNDFVYGMGIMHRGSLEEKAREAFRVYDQDDDGYLGLEEFSQVIYAYFSYSQKLTQDISFCSNDDKILSIDEVLKDQPISAAFTGIIPSDSQSILNKNMERMREEISLIRQPDVRQEIQENLYRNSTLARSALSNLSGAVHTDGSSDAQMSGASSSLDEFTNAVQSADSSRSRFSISVDGADLKNPKKDTTSGSDSISLKPKDNTKLGSKKVANEGQSIIGESSKQYKEGQNLPDSIDIHIEKDSTISTFTDKEEAKDTYATSSEGISDKTKSTDLDPALDLNLNMKDALVWENSILDHHRKKNGYIESLENSVIASARNNIWEDPSLQEDWPILDVMLMESVSILASDLFELIPSRSRKYGLSEEEFVELEGKVLYERLMVAAKNFKTYNFRAYFERRISQDYKAFGQAEFIQRYKSQLPVLERQSAINSMYSFQSSIMDTQNEEAA